MSKDIEEKKLKKEKKDKKEKRAEKDGVTKSKKDKKEKKIKGDVEMTDALEAELEKEPEVSMVNIVDGASGDDEPRGALVPFAFPLADNDKEVKKILKTVKKCTFTFPKTRSHNPHISTNFFSLQPPSPRPSAAVSKKSSRRCANPPPQALLRPSATPSPLSSSPPTSRPWTSLRTSLSSAKTTTCPTSTSRAARNSARLALQSDLPASS